LGVGSTNSLSKQRRQQKLEQMESQTNTYFSVVFDTDFNSNQGENATCESIRHQKEERWKSGDSQKPPIPATDMVFPGQGFFQHRKDSQTQQYYLTKTAVRWDDKAQSFNGYEVKHYGTLAPHSMIKSSGRQSGLEGSLDCGKRKCEGTHVPILIPRELVDGITFQNVKKMFASHPNPGEDYETFFARIAQLVGESVKHLLPTKQGQSGRASALQDWEIKSVEWNKSLEPGLKEAVSLRTDLFPDSPQGNNLKSPPTATAIGRRRSRKKKPTVPRKLPPMPPTVLSSPAPITDPPTCTPFASAKAATVVTPDFSGKKKPRTRTTKSK
jgi:hypothetical protein